MSQYSCTPCEHFKLEGKEILQNVNNSDFFQWWSCIFLHLFVILYFQIWLKWEYVTFIFRGKKFPPTPLLYFLKKLSPTHLRRSVFYLPGWFAFFFFYRATAFGILNGLCKFGAILGNTIFASFVGITKVVPILLAATSLVGGGLIALRLPETREQVLMWQPLGKGNVGRTLSSNLTCPTLPVHRCPEDTWIAQEEKLFLWPLV